MISLIVFIIVVVLTLLIFKRSFKKNGLSLIYLYLVTVVICLIILFNIDLFKNQVKGNIFDSMDSIIPIFLLATQISLLLDSFIMLPLQRLHEKNIRNKYEQKYNVESFEYYRELIKNIPAAILGYLYNNKISTEDAIIATVLDLERKNIIKINDNNIELIDDKYELTDHEKFIIYDYNKYKSIKTKNKIFFFKIRSDMEDKNNLKNKYDEMNIIDILNFFLLLSILSPS